MVFPEMLRADLIGEFRQFIATEEGFFTPGTIAQRHNNPGNLISWGHYPIVQGYAAFPTAAEGWEALREQIVKNIFVRQLTFNSFFAGQRDARGHLLTADSYPGFCPAHVEGNRLTKGNKPDVYARKAVEWINHKLGCAASSDTVIESLVD